MGRKLPKSKKHKKLKFVDPCYSGSFSLKKNKNVNLPPSSGDQEVPYHMKEFIDSKNKAKNNTLKRRKKKKVIKDDFIIVKNEIIDNVEPGTRKVKKMPRVVKQKRFENEYQFFNRLQKMADVAIAEAKVEDKYNIELVNVDKQGNAEYKSIPQEKPESKKKKRRKTPEKQEKIKKIKVDESQFELKKEKIQFGEVVDAPPILTARPRKAPDLNKAGKRELHLKKLLSNNTNQNKEKKIVLQSTKLKSLPAEKREEMEKERLRVVEMYRKLKNKKAP